MMPFLYYLLLGLQLTFSPGHFVVQITDPDFLRPVEPSIAINPTDPDNLIAGSIRFGAEGEPRVVSMRYHSRDGGKTWKQYEEANPDLRPQGDDAVVFNREGIAYHSYISFRGLRTTKPRANGIYVTRSQKDTDIWHEPVVVVDHLNTHRPYEDKPYLVTDNTAGSPHEGNVYIAWTRFDGYQSPDPNDSTQIYFARSIDKGARFEEPFRISDSGGDCADSDYTVEGAVPAVGLDGEVFISWSGPRGLIFDKSLDGGKTFGKDTVLTELVGGWDIDIPGIYRCNGFPVTKVDLSQSEYNGSIYINWSDQRFGDPDIFVMYSRDKGKSWSLPVRVNDDALFNGKAQFFTWMAVDPADGSVNIVFYDRRDGEGTETSVMLARSVDGGQTFANSRIDLPAFECNEKIFFGDYTGIDAYNGRVAAIFPHFTGQEHVAISVAVFDFKLNSPETR